MYDKNKLSRDYSTNPVQPREIINKEDLNYLYNDCGIKIPELTKILGTTVHTLYKNLHLHKIMRVSSHVSKATEAKVDYTKLSRDFRVQPLAKNEPPKKEDFAYLYITLDLTKGEVAEVFGRGTSERFASKWITILGLQKPSELARARAKETYKERTGYDHPLHNPEARKKLEETNKERYGYTWRWKNKELQQADLAKSNSEENIEKAKKTRIQTNRNRYGTDYPFQNREVWNNASKSIYAKLGATSYPQSLIPKETLDILQNKDRLEKYIVATGYHSGTYIAKTLGISQTTLIRYMKAYGLMKYIKTCESTYEVEIKKLFPEIKFRKDRTILNGKEIDLYDPVHKIGIEFNGNYWHSEANKDKYYHSDKSAEAAAKGVFIYHIFEYEWLDPRSKAAIINQLKNLFGLNKFSIYARKCEVRLVGQSEARAFLDANHVQGRTIGHICLGLYHGKELVALMEFITNPLNKEYQYELNRFCGKAGYNVLGGASKLFSYFIKNYNPKSIISYSDIAKTKGHLYEVLGFKNVGTTKLQYHWTNGDVTFTRYETQRKQLIRKGLLLENDPRSEMQIMHAREFFRIWDCGKIQWGWTR